MHLTLRVSLVAEIWDTTVRAVSTSSAVSHVSSQLVMDSVKCVTDSVKDCGAHNVQAQL